MKPRSVRYLSLSILFGLATLAVLWRYGELAAKGPATPRDRGVDITRGAILDAAGRTLAVDVSLYNIAIWRPGLDRGELGATGSMLERELGLEAGEAERRIAASASDFLYLTKRLSADQVRGIQEARSGGALEGVIVEKIAGRLYPEKRLASHVLGFVGDENRGLAGIEARYDQELSPVPESGSEAPAGIVYGPSVRLTIDANLQYAFEGIARRVHEENKPEATMLLAMDAQSGAILAYVSLPDYDPNRYGDFPATTWYDRPAQYAYEPGSVFKVFSMASLLELGGIDSSSTFVCDGAYEREVPGDEADIRIRCLGVHGVVDVSDILTYSCNAGSGYASDTVAPLDFYEALRQFGFGGRSGVQLSGETAGLLRSPEQWSLRSKPTIAIGQEVLVSAVQVLAAAGAIANGGVLMKPRLVDALIAPDGSTLHVEEAQVVRRVVSSETARIVLDAMERAAGPGGTGRRAGSGDIRLGVKTGTAQMIDPASGGYSEDDYLASTLGIFPIDKPRYVVYMALAKPRGASYFGERIAAPALREAAEILASMSDLPRPGEEVALHSGRIQLAAPTELVVGERMPDLRGLPKKSLLPLLDREDLRVEIEGQGRVREQTPEPGAPLAEGTVIILRLE